jgi:hypothetical protein
MMEWRRASMGTGSKEMKARGVKDRDMGGAEAGNGTPSGQRAKPGSRLVGKNNAGHHGLPSSLK